MNPNRRNRCYVLVGLALLSGFGCAGSRRGQVTLLHTNDMHSQFSPSPATWVQKEPKPLIGGMVALEYQVRRQRAAHPGALLFDAGDIMTGTPLSKMAVDSALGGGFVRMMNLLDYDAMTIGNHEFDEGQANLEKLLGLVRFDVLSANLFKQGRLFADKPYAIYRSGRLRIGVIGVTLMELFEMTAIKNLEGIEVKEPAPIVQKIVDDIDARTDLILLLSHQGVEADLALADRLRGVDVIIGGHSHSRLNDAIRRNGILVVQAGDKTRYLGALTVRVGEDRVEGFDYRLIPTWVDSVRDADAEMVQLVENYQRRIEDEYGRVIGDLAGDWQRNGAGESTIGNYLADVVRKAVGVDMALLNSGGIRKDMARGPIRKIDIIEILPFSNYIVLFECTGEQVFEIIRTNARSAARNDAGILQISGLRYSYRVRADGVIDVLSATLDGQPIDPAGRYRIATVDFVLQGQAERYFGFMPQQGIESTNRLVSDVVIDYIEKNPAVSAVLDGRIQRLP